MNYEKAHAIGSSQDWNRGTSLGGGVASQTAQIPAVHVAQEGLDKSVAVLLNALDSIEARLQPILSAMPSSGEKPEKPASPNTVAGRIEAASEAVSYAGRRVSYLLERLEV